MSEEADLPGCVRKKLEARMKLQDWNSKAANNAEEAKCSRYVVAVVKQGRAGVDNAFGGGIKTRKGTN